MRLLGIEILAHPVNFAVLDFDDKCSGVAVIFARLRLQMAPPLDDHRRFFLVLILENDFKIDAVKGRKYIRPKGFAARKNNTPRQPSAARTGHLHQNTNGESHENVLLGLEINAAHGDVDGFSGIATVDGRIHWTKDEWNLEIEARRKTPIQHGQH